MTQRTRQNDSRERGVFHGVRRACRAQLDSVLLRREVARRSAIALQADASVLLTSDPGTRLFTHAVGRGACHGLVRLYLDAAFPYHPVVPALSPNQAECVVLSRSTDCDALQAKGFRHELHAALCVDGELWGAWCLLRTAKSPPFDDDEIDFVRTVAPHLARGLKSAARSQPTATSSEQDDERCAMAGVVVLDARWRVALRTPSAVAQMQDLADVGMGPEEVPFAVASAVLQRRLRQTAGACPPDHSLHARGRSGRWYLLRAELAEPVASGSSAPLVVIEPASPADVAAIQVHLYGLSPRERQVLALVARGEPSKQIARRLGLSVYTVEDHLKHACQRVGVHGSRALLAKLFFDSAAKRVFPSVPLDT